MEKKGGSTMSMDPSSPSSTKPRIITMKRILLALNCLMLAIGIVGGPLVMRLYFLHGGNRTWLQSFLETAGFPVMSIPILFTGYKRQQLEKSTKLLRITWRLFGCAAVLGVLAGTSNSLYARGNQLIPVSTSSLVLSTHLVFTAVFCYFLVGQKFTAFIVNAIVLLTTGAVVLATAGGGGGGGGGMKGESEGNYLKGFFMVMGSGAIFAAVLPTVELCYIKSGALVNYQLVMEMQFVLSCSATIFCACGMAISKDWQAISTEARNSDLGPTLYYCVLVACSFTWQFFFLGVLGVIHFGSSLLSAIITAVCLPLSELLAVVFYGEKFQPEKGVALILSLWGFVSYFYGELQRIKAKEGGRSTEDSAGNSAPQLVIESP